jgi:hypothetical protein
VMTKDARRFASTGGWDFEVFKSNGREGRPHGRGPSELLRVPFKGQPRLGLDRVPA